QVVQPALLLVERTRNAVDLFGRHHVSAQTAFDLRQPLVIAVLEGLEGGHELGEGVLHVEVVRALRFQNRVFLWIHCICPFGSMRRVAWRMISARLCFVPIAASRWRMREAKPLAMTIRASLLESPASRVSQDSNSLTVGRRFMPPLTVPMRAPGSMGNVTTEISHRSASRIRRMPVAASRRARTVRKPMDSPSSAPTRMSA